MLPPLPVDESRRLARLRALDILDTQAEPVFDSLVAAAASLCGVPIALISLVDAERQWFKARIGLGDVTETPREVAFCAHAIVGDDVLLVPDATADERFADNPLVVGDPNIRFYAGAPITLSDGHRVGTLCVIDRIVRDLTDDQRRLLSHLAAATASALEIREKFRDAYSAQSAMAEHFARLYEATPAMLCSVDGKGRIQSLSDRWCMKFGRARADMIGQPLDTLFDAASRDALMNVALPRTLAGGAFATDDYRVVCADGSVLDVAFRSIVENAAADDQRILVVLEDITARNDARERLEWNNSRLASIIEGTNVGTWEWNVQTGETRFNARWAEIVGYTLAELEPISIDTWSRLAHPDDLAVSAEALQRHFDGELAYYDVEARMRHKDGHWVWVHDRGRVASFDADGRPLWMMGTHADISEKNETLLALASAKNLLERTGEIARVGGWKIDLRENRLSWSRHTCEMLGLEPGTIATPEYAIETFAPTSGSRLREVMATVVADKVAQQVEIDMVTLSGQSFRASVTIKPELEGTEVVRLVGAIQDVSRRYEAELALAESRQLLEVTLESIGDAVITTDLACRVRWMNPVAERLTGWTNADARGRPMDEVFNIIVQGSREPAPNPVPAVLRGGETLGLTDDTVLVSRSGEEFAIQDSAAPIRDRDGELLGVVLVFHDVSEQRRLGDEMRYRATHDSLTGLVNREEFEHRLHRILENAKERRSRNALMYIDLDHFKIVNDSCGHTAGDTVLKQVAELLGSHVRHRDTLARLGGDEFAVLLEHCTTSQALRVANAICAAMNEFRFIHEDKPFRIGTSIGLVPIDADSTTEAAILQAADASCYAAKEAGRNRVHVWRQTDRSLRDQKGQMHWATRIEHALDDDRFLLYAQPIVPMHGQATGVRCEVLLRMRLEDGTIAAPGAFLSAAERYGLSTRVDGWVIRQVFAFLANAGAGMPLDTVCVNISGRSIGDRVFHEFLARELDAAKFDLGSLCLEITETAAITNMAQASRFARTMQSRGIKVALDDFGAGAASFGYLKQLPVNYLKIDGQFIRNLLADPLDLVTVRCFTEVAQAIGLKTVAECVESLAVAQKLRELGVDFGQGYLWGRPVPIANLFASGTSARSRAAAGAIAG